MVLVVLIVPREPEIVFHQCPSGRHIGQEGPAGLQSLSKSATWRPSKPANLALTESAKRSANRLAEAGFFLYIQVPEDSKNRPKWSLKPSNA
jgi:hypothetical protein